MHKNKLKCSRVSISRIEDHDIRFINENSFVIKGIGGFSYALMLLGILTYPYILIHIFINEGIGAGALIFVLFSYIYYQGAKRFFEFLRLPKYIFKKRKLIKGGVIILNKDDEFEIIKNIHTYVFKGHTKIKYEIILILPDNTQHCLVVSENKNKFDKVFEIISRNISKPKVLNETDFNSSENKAKLTQKSEYKITVLILVLAMIYYAYNH